MRTLALLCLLPLPCLAQPLLPKLVATQPRLSLSPDYIGFDIQSRCGSDWMFFYNGEWACVRHVGNRVTVTDAGRYSGPTSLSFWQRLVRGPIAGDNKVYMATTNPFFSTNPVAAIDPMTGARSEFALTSALPSDPVFYAQLPGDPNPTMIGITSGSSALITLPGGLQPPFQTLATTNIKTVVSGQFDADGASELGWLAPGTGLLRFRDASTLIDEPWTPLGTFTEARPAWSGDWDGDGHDEIAMATAANGSLALLDPDMGGSYREPALPMPDIYRALGLLDWTAAGSRELVALGNDHVAVVDPRSGAVLRDQSLAPGGVGRVIAKALDWDNDGDQDLLWFDQGSMRLLRNPEGASVLQWSHGESHALGYFQAQGEQQLVVVIEAGGDLLIRRLNPRTLSTITEIVVPNLPFPSPGNVQSPEFLLGDFHSSPGPEILRISSTLLRAFALDGTQLWERAASTNSEYSFVQLSDSECAGIDCPPLAVQERSTTGNSIVQRVLNGQDGSVFWSSSPSNQSQALRALTQLSGDSYPELVVHAEQRLRAIDARTGQIVWDVPMNSVQDVRAVRRNGNRLAVMLQDSTLVLLDINGSELNRRQLSLNGSCESLCRLSYLARPAEAGDWIVTGSRPQYMAVRDDLSGEVTSVDDSLQTFLSLQVASPTLLNGVRDNEVRAWELVDQLFGNGFEE